MLLLSQSWSFNSTLPPPHRLRQKGTMSFLDSVHIKVHSTSYDDIELTPSNDQGVEMTVEASTIGKQDFDDVGHCYYMYSPYLLE